MPPNRKANEPESPHFPEEWGSDEHVDAGAVLESVPPPALGLVCGYKRTRCPCRKRVAEQQSPDTPSFDSISDIPDKTVFDNLESDQSLDRRQPGPIDDVCTVGSDACSGPSVYSSARVVSLADTQHRPNGTRRSSGVAVVPDTKA